MTRPTLSAVLRHAAELFPGMTDPAFPIAAADVYGAIVRSAAELSGEPRAHAYRWAREADDALEAYLVRVESRPCSVDVIGRWLAGRKAVEVVAALDAASDFYTVELIGGAS